MSHPVHDIFYWETRFWSFKRLVDILSSVTGNFMYSVNGVLYGLTSQPIELNIYMSLKCQENLSISLACFLKTCTIKELRLSGIVWYVASFISKSKVSLASVESQRSFNIESHTMRTLFAVTYLRRWGGTVVQCSSDKILHWTIHITETKMSSFWRNFIIGCTESCHFDNFQCSQWWKFRQMKTFPFQCMAFVNECMYGCRL